jgi:hypothetical protein
MKPEFTVEQCLSLAAQGLEHTDYWANKAREIASGIEEFQIAALRDEAKVLSRKLRRHLKQAA